MDDLLKIVIFIILLMFIILFYSNYNNCDKKETFIEDNYPNKVPKPFHQIWFDFSKNDTLNNTIDDTELTLLQPKITDDKNNFLLNSPYFDINVRVPILFKPDNFNIIEWNHEEENHDLFG